MGNSEEAEKLADRMRQVIGVDETVGRPIRKTPVLLLGIREWMSPEDITREVLMADESLLETQVLVRDNIGGGRVARLEVPMAAALRLAENKTVKIGWSRCRVKLLEHKSPKCFKCCNIGHVASTCPEQTVQAKRCFRCRQAGHLIKDCSGPKSRSMPATTEQEESAGVSSAQSMSTDD